VSPDERLLAVGAASGGLTVYDTATLTRRTSVGVSATRAAFSPDGSTIAVATGGASGRDGGGSPVVLIDAASGAIDRLPTSAPTGPATGVAFIDEGRLAAALEPSAFDQSVARPATVSNLLVWDLAAGSARRFPVAGTQPTLALDAERGLAFVGTIRGGDGPWLSVIDVTTGVTVREAAIGVRPVAVSPDGTLLAGIDGHDAVLMSTAGLAEELRLEAHRPLVEDGSFSTDGRRFVTAGLDGTAMVWDVRPSLGAVPDGGQVPRRVVELAGHAGRVSGTALSADGATLYTVAADELLLVWDLVGERRLLARDPTASVTPRPRPSMRHTDAGIELRAPGTQLAVRAPVPFNGTVRAMFPSLDWDRAAVITTDRTIAIVDFSRSVIAGSLRVSWTPVWAAFSPDGARLAVTGSDGQVALVDVGSISWRAPPVLAHHGEAGSVDWSADGTLFVTGGTDGRVGLWDGVTGSPVGLMEVGAGGEQADVHFEDHEVVIDAGATYRFDTGVAAWIAHACAVVGRSLTAEEWAGSFGDDAYRETCPGD
jgi:WD40 repeat protein